MRHRVVLSDVCEIVQGGRHRLSGNDFVKTGFPAYGAGGMNGFLESYEFDRPAVILSSIGARCGKCFYAVGRWSSLANTQVILPELTLVDTRFLWHQLNDEERWPRSGTAQPFIKPSDVKRHLVFLPPLLEQRRIAAILDQAEALRAKRRAALAKLETLAQSIFIEMFGDPAGNPRRWPVKQLAELTRHDDRINYGVIQPGEDVEDGVPLIRVGDLTGGRICHSFLKRITPSIEAAYKRSRLRGDEILVSCVGSIGVVALADSSVRGFNIARAVARIPVGDSVERVFLAEALKTDAVQRYFTSELRTVSQPTLNIKQIGETQIPIPPKTLQLEFQTRAGCFEKLSGLHRVFLDQLDALFASLHHRAFRGEL